MKTKMSSEKKLLVLACILICGAGQGVLINTSSVFIKPVCDSLGFARGDFSLYTSITMLLMMLLLSLFGVFYSRPWFKRVVLPMGIICGLIPMGYSFCTSLWQFYLLSALMGIFINGISMQMVACVITRSFVEKRGLILGMSFAGSGLLAAGAVSVAGWINSVYGWRTGYCALSLISLCVLLITVPILTRYGFQEVEGEEEKVSAPDAPISGVRLKQAVRMPSFYLLLISLFLMGLVLQGTMINSVACLADHDYSVAIQNMVASLSMFVAAVAKLGLGQMMDRYGVKAGAVPAFAGMALSGIFLILVDLPIAPYMIILGTGLNNSGAVIQSELTRECFGQTEHARIYTILSTGCALGITVGASVPGYVLKLSGSYAPAWWGFVAAAVIGMTFCFTAMNISGKYRERMSG